MRPPLIIVFYFCWRMLVDSLTFELSSTLERKKNQNLDPHIKEQSEKRQTMTLLALIFKLPVMY